MNNFILFISSAEEKKNRRNLAQVLYKQQLLMLLFLTDEKRTIDLKANNFSRISSPLHASLLKEPWTNSLPLLTTVTATSD